MINDSFKSRVIPMQRQNDSQQDRINRLLACGAREWLKICFAGDNFQNIKLQCETEIKLLKLQTDEDRNLILAQLDGLKKQLRIFVVGKSELTNQLYYNQSLTTISLSVDKLRKQSVGTDANQKHTDLPVLIDSVIDSSKKIPQHNVINSTRINHFFNQLIQPKPQQLDSNLRNYEIEISRIQGEIERFEEYLREIDQYRDEAIAKIKQKYNVIKAQAIDEVITKIESGLENLTGPLKKKKKHDASPFVETVIAETPAVAESIEPLSLNKKMNFIFDNDPIRCNEYELYFTDQNKYIYVCPPLYSDKDKLVEKLLEYSKCFLEKVSEKFKESEIYITKSDPYIGIDITRLKLKSVKKDTVTTDIVTGHQVRNAFKKGLQEFIKNLSQNNRDIAAPANDAATTVTEPYDESEDESEESLNLKRRRLSR